MMKKYAIVDKKKIVDIYLLPSPLPNVFLIAISIIKKTFFQLWSFATRKEKLYDFKTIDEVFEENFRFKREIKELKEQLNTNMTYLKEGY